MQKKTRRYLAAVLIFTFLSCLCGCAKPVSCEVLAERFADALMRADGEKALLLMPEEMLSYLSDRENQNRQELAQRFSKQLRQRLASFGLRYGTVRSYSCRIKRFRDYSEEDLTRLNSRYQKYRFTADAARELTIMITLTLENGTKLSTFFSLEIFRIGRSWYMDCRHWMHGQPAAGRFSSY